MNNQPVITKVHIILTVSDISKSRMFYNLLFNITPIVDESNICEFQLTENLILGLQNEDLKLKNFDPDIYMRFAQNKHTGGEEIYIEHSDAEGIHTKALQLGCLELSPFKERNWGHKVGYSINHDGHILAFAEAI